MTFRNQIATLDQSFSTSQREQVLAFMARFDVDGQYLAIVQPPDDLSDEERDMHAVANGIAIFGAVPKVEWTEFREILGSLSESFDAAIETVQEQFKEMMP